MGNSFKKGMGFVSTNSKEQVENRIKNLLRIESRNRYSFYLNGKGNITDEQKIAIERIFSDYGVSSENVWG